MSQLLPIINPSVNAMAADSSCDAGEGKNGSIVSRYLDNLGDPRGERQPHGPLARHPLPMSMEEAKSRGWDEIDIVFVTGDAYIDHPSFAMSILARGSSRISVWLGHLGCGTARNFHAIARANEVYTWSF